MTIMLAQHGRNCNIQNGLGHTYLPTKRQGFVVAAGGTLAGYRCPPGSYLMPLAGRRRSPFCGPVRVAGRAAVARPGGWWEVRTWR
jgi:hypothetical protein